MVPSLRNNFGVKGSLSLILVEIIPFSQIIKTPFALPGPPISEFAGIISGCGGRIPPSVHVISIGHGFFSVESKFRVIKDEGGQPSGIYSGVHIFVKTLPTLHSASLGYFKPRVLYGISIK